MKANSPQAAVIMSFIKKVPSGLEETVWTDGKNLYYGYITVATFARRDSYDFTDIRFPEVKDDWTRGAIRLQGWCKEIVNSLSNT